MKITLHAVAEKLIAYLYHRISLAEIVNWAESAMMDGEFEDYRFKILRDSVK